MSEVLTYSNFLKNKENEQIFYSTNFFPEEGQEYHDVIIFNYGLVCSNFHWTYQLPYFHEKGYKVLVHDYRGHYQSTVKSIESINFRNITNDIYEICQRLNIKSTHIFGHSMGVNVSPRVYSTFSRTCKKTSTHLWYRYAC